MFRTEPKTQKATLKKLKSPFSSERVGILRHVETAGFYAALLYTALLLLPTYYSPILAGLDPSWGFGLNYFSHSELKFGPDLIFTYGPLGYICVPMNIGSNIAIAMLVRVAVWALVLWQLISIRLSGKRVAVWLLVVSMIFSNRLYWYYWDYLLTAAILILCYRLITDDGPKTMEFALLTMLMGLSFLVKISVFVVGTMAFVIFVVGQAIGPRGFGVRRLRFWLLIVFASGPIAYLLYHPSIRDLLLYIKGTSEITSGYAAWMSLPTENALALRAGIVIAIMAVCAVHAVWMRTLRVVPAVLMLVVTFVAFRHGFIRSDAAHSAVFLSFSILIFAVLLASVSVTKRTAVIYAIVFCVFSSIALQGVAAAWPVQSSFWWSPMAKLEEVNRIWQWDRTLTWLKAVSGESLKATVIDQYGSDIPGARVLVFPWDLSFAARQEFKLAPLYTMQAYIAYTRYLDRRSAERFLSADPPIDFVLFQWQSIDGRHPLLDVPAIWNALYNTFVPDRVHAGSVLLKRRPQPIRVSYAPLMSPEFHPNTWISVPLRSTPVGISIDLRPTIAGSLLTALYKLPIVFLEMRTLSGATKTFRVPADVLVTPFPVNSLPMSFDLLLEMWSEHRSSDPVVELRLTGDGLPYLRGTRWHFYDVTGVDISVAGAPESLRSRFGLNKAADISNLLSGYIDSANGTRMPRLDASDSPVIVDAQQGVTLGGWVTYGDYASAITMDEIYAVVPGSLVQAERVQRPDVAAHFRNPHLNLSGYTVRLSSTLLDKGFQSVELIGYTRADHRLYRLPGSLYVFVK